MSDKRKKTTRAAKTPPGKGGRGKKAVPAVAEAPTFAGQDRVLEFADSLQRRREKKEEKRQELETWVSCRIEGELLALPVRQVQEILRVGDLTRVPHAPYPVRGVTNMRGYVLPVVDLRIRLGLEPVEPGPRHRIVVISSRGRLVGLLVDEVEHVVQVDRLAIEPPPEDVVTDRSYYLAGVFRHDEGLLILLDADRVLQVRQVDEIAVEQ